MQKCDNSYFSREKYENTFQSSTVGKIYTQIFSFFEKIVVNIVFLELRPLSNQRSVNFTFYRGIHEFSNSFIFYLEKKVFNFYYAAVSISQKILRNGNYNIEFKKKLQK